MPIIDNTSPAYNQLSSQYWSDELQNLRILLYSVNVGIKTLLSSNHQSYQLDTGQSSQRVTRLSLAELQAMRGELMFQINELEINLGIKPICQNVQPGW